MQIQLHCPNCNSSVPATNVVLEKAIAICSNCDTVFNINDKLDQLGRNRPEVYLPNGIEAYSTPNELNIEVAWKSGLSTFMVLFTIFWNAIVLPFAVVAILSGSFAMLLAISVHLIIGVSLLYWLIAGLVNTTTIIVERKNLEITHAPLKIPFYPARLTPTNNINQLYTNRYRNGSVNGQPTYAFAVHVIFNDKQDIRLVTGLKKSQQARYIEQEIERFLQLKDRSVEGEWE